jgi:hypothetical protein
MSDFHVLLLAWAKSQAPNAVDHALSILNLMEQQELQPDVQTYSSLIVCIARRGENPEQAEDMLKCMAKAGVDPNIVTYNTVINGRFGYPFQDATSEYFCV